MAPKQKRAVAALIVAALVAAAALFAPGAKCEPDQSLIEDALGGASSGAAPGPDVPAEQPATPSESASSGPAAGSSGPGGSTGA